MAAPLRVLVTSAGGQLAYSITYIVAKGDVFGPKQSIILILLDNPEMLKALEGLRMELADCTLPLLQQVIITSDISVAFKDIEAAFLITQLPQQQCMARKDVLAANVKVFKEYGQALNQYSRKCVRVIVAGNTSNTLAYICKKFAPKIPSINFSAMSRIDLNRTCAQIADKLRVPVNSISNVVVWGNQSKSIVPDMNNAICKANGCLFKVAEAIDDPEYLTGKFVTDLAERENKIGAAGTATSPMSTARATCDQMRDWWCDTSRGQYTCMSVISDGSYGAPTDVFFSFPVTTKNGDWSIVRGLYLTDFIKRKIALAGRELVAEKAEALKLLESN